MFNIVKNMVLDIHTLLKQQNVVKQCYNIYLGLYYQFETNPIIIRILLIIVRRRRRRRSRPRAIPLAKITMRKAVDGFL